ncbi:MAG: NADH-quinone oxidoreductase subunit C [Chloroflexi bacterium]|nr:NADH-quinone oxidoreductase subunit C [Chloroflexota bacterium]|tara:strand:- start:5758 stop:6204 length:447 start_codon:yes stop_codon:yes gene_type:complete
MTKCFSGEKICELIDEINPQSVVSTNSDSVHIQPESALSVFSELKNKENCQFNLLNSLTAVDYIDHFEMVYHLTSTIHNHSIVIKIICGEGRKEPKVSSVVNIWRGADLQEREVWDLMGITFENHPNLKRLLLWEEFPGHPLRKDYLR